MIFIAISRRYFLLRRQLTLMSQLIATRHDRCRCRLGRRAAAAASRQLIITMATPFSPFHCHAIEDTPQH
jgi:hypothetical protein